MIIESYRNASGSIAIDYKKGYVLEENTNKIRCYPCYKFILIKEGRSTYTDSEGVTKVPERSLILVKAQEVHNPHTDTAHLYERYRISFSPDFARELLREGLFPDAALAASYKKPLNDADFAELLLYFEGIFSALKGEAESKNQLLACGTRLVAALLKGATLTPRRQEIEENYVADVVAYIKENYATRLTAEQIASRFFVSRGKLIYDFKAWAKMSLLEYITMTRVEAAKELLSRGYAVVAVAEQCGFSTSSYFIKVFSRITGMTPLKYQRQFGRR